MVAWNAVTDVNDGQSFGGAAWQTAIDAVEQIQDALGSDVPAWTAYTPAVVGSGWALGSTGATAYGVYIDLGGIIHFHARCIFGTTGATFSTNNPGVTLPVSAAEPAGGLPSRNTVICELVDTSAGTSYRGGGDVAGITYALPMPLNASATYLTEGYANNTIPFTWAAGDEIRMSGWYRKL